jgi:hypothetical protein
MAKRTGKEFMNGRTGPDTKMNIRMAEGQEKRSIQIHSETGMSNTVTMVYKLAGK